MKRDLRVIPALSRFHFLKLFLEVLEQNVAMVQRPAMRKKRARKSVRSSRCDNPRSASGTIDWQATGGCSWFKIFWLCRRFGGVFLYFLVADIVYIVFAS